ncbi:MAG: hypothetical protein AB1806_01865 [Acidobacteriota bacterium]
MFGLRGIESQCQRLFGEIRVHLTKALFRNTMTDLFGRLRSPRKRVMSARHVQILSMLLDGGPRSLSQLARDSRHAYAVKNPMKALMRDLGYLGRLQVIHATRPEGAPDLEISVNLNWPSEITETELFRRVKDMPKGRVYGFLSV